MIKRIYKKVKLSMALITINALSFNLYAATIPNSLSDVQWQNIGNQITVNTQQAYIKSSNNFASSLFGFSISMLGDTMVVGARSEFLTSGAVYVFTHTNGIWTQEARLVSSNLEADDRFGTSVALGEGVLVVGATGEDSNATGVNGDESNNLANNSGAVYIFTRNSGVWNQEAYLKSPNTEGNGIFGNAVAISGDTIVVGASNETHAGLQSGAAYVFVRNSGSWTLQSELFTTNTSPRINHFGTAVSISGNTIAISAPDEDFNTGGVYVLTRTGETWSLQDDIRGLNTESNDFFGSSIALEADRLVVGAYDESSNATGVNGDQNDNSAMQSGAAYIFIRDTGVWTQQAYLKASNTGAGDAFGTSVAISGNRIVVGAQWEQSNTTGIDGDGSDNSINASGAAYSFLLQGGNWTPQSYIKASNTQQSGQGDWFGTSVAVSGDIIAIGAPWEDSNATVINGNQNDDPLSGNAGAVYIFENISEIVFSDSFE